MPTASLVRVGYGRPALADLKALGTALLLRGPLPFVPSGVGWALVAALVLDLVNEVDLDAGSVSTALAEPESFFPILEFATFFTVKYTMSSSIPCCATETSAGW